MKKINVTAAYKFLMLLLLSFTQALVWAQDSNAVTKTVSNDKFVVQPWMWIAGGVIVLLLLIALLSGNSKKEVAVTKTTVIKETEIK